MSIINITQCFGKGKRRNEKRNVSRQRYAVFGRKGNAAPGAYCRGGFARDKAASAVYRYKYVAGHGFVFSDYSCRNAVFAKKLFCRRFRFFRIFGLQCYIAEKP